MVGLDQGDDAVKNRGLRFRNATINSSILWNLNYIHLCLFIFVLVVWYLSKHKLFFNEHDVMKTAGPIYIAMNYYLINYSVRINRLIL